MTAVDAANRLRSARTTGTRIGLVAGSLLGGLGLGAAGARYGPAVVVAVPLGLSLLLWAWQRPLVAAAGVPLALPVGLLPVAGELQVIQVVLVLSAGVVLAHRLVSGRGPLPLPPVAWWGVALLTLMVAATPNAASLPLAVRQLGSAAAGLLMALAVVAACRRMHDVRLLVGLLLLAGSAVCLGALPQIGQLSATADATIVTGAVTGVFSERNALGSFSAVVVLLAVGMVFGARSRRRRAAAALAGALSVTTLALSLSRGAWIGAVAGGLCLLVLLPPARRAVLIGGVPLLLLATLLGAFGSSPPHVTLVTERVGTLGDPGSNPYDDRPAIWREGLRQVRADPWTGFGPGSFPVTARRSTSVATFAEPEHAHNVLLTVAAEAGLPAAGALVGLSVGVAVGLRRTVRRQSDHRDAAVVAGIAAALASIVGQGLVDFMLRNPVLSALAFLLLGLSLGAANAAAAGGPAASSAGARAGRPAR